MIESLASPIETVVWLALLWYTSGLITPRDSTEPADRVRDSIFLGVAIAFALALLHVFFRPVCLGVAFALALYRYAREKGAFSRDDPSRTESRRDRLAYAIPVLTVVTVGWPGLVRPLLEGDSLAYHLPNAAAWAGMHSFWTSTTTYWWYPPGSELFASALFVIGGPAVVTIAGFAATLLLSLRLVAFCRRANIDGWKAGVISAAIATIPMIALQSGSLQNDVWLAAWALESIWAAIYERGALIRSLSICMLVKPTGIVCALLIALLTRMRAAAVLAAAAPYLIWVLHDILLWRHAVVAPAQTLYPNLVGTTVLAHGAAGIGTLLAALFAQGIGTVILALSIPLALACAPDLVRRNFPWMMTLAFLAEPFGYKNALPQLANGSSLRFLLPALVTGAVGSFALLSRAAIAAALSGAVLTIIQIRTILGIFANDANTHGAVAVGIGAAVVVVLFRARHLATVAIACYLTAVVTYAVRLDNDPSRYYDAWLSDGSTPSGLFHWIAMARPAAVVVWRLRSGAVSIVSPGSLVEDAALPDPCAQARRNGAVLVLANDQRERVLQPVADKKLVTQCGHIVFEDATAVVVAPSSSPPAVPRTARPRARYLKQLIRRLNLSSTFHGNLAGRSTRAASTGR